MNKKKIAGFMEFSGGRDEGIPPCCYPLPS